MSRPFLLLIILLIASYACKKEHDRPQWDIELVGPLLHASFGIDDLLGDSSIEASADGAQVVHYDSTFSDFNLDSIFTIPDTTIQTLVNWFPIPQKIPPDFPFFSNNNNINLGIGNVQLKRANIESGKIRLEIKNTLQAKIIFIYTIPKAIKNGLPFTVTASVDSASPTDPKYFTGEYDFSGYELNLTGISGTAYNSISYNVEARTDPNGDSLQLVGLDTIVNLKTTLVSVKPYFASGYLGQAQNTAMESRNMGIGGLIKNGMINLDSVKLNLDIVNYIGADEQAFINSMKSINDRTGSTVDLIAPSIIQHYLNINRAVINNSLPDSLVPSYYYIQLDNSNSNIVELIENIPDKIDYDLNLKFNPMGNISGSNDFVFSHKLITTRFQLRIPLRFAANQLVFADTVPFTINGATNYDAVGYTTLTLIAENGFPFDLNAQLFLLDSNQAVVDSLFTPDLIRAAPYDASYKATGKTRTLIDIPVDAVRKQKLLEVQRVGVRLQFNTPDYPQLIQMYSQYHLDLKLVADGIYSIR